MINETLLLPQAPIYGHNCTEGRGGRSIDFICFHITYGSFQSLLNCLTSSDPGDYMRSAHIFPNRDGLLYRMVEDKDTAWTCGLLYPRNYLKTNQRSLNIEMICEEDQIVTDAQYDSVRWIVKKWMLDYHIPRVYPSTGFEGYWSRKNGVRTYIRPSDDELAEFRGLLAHSALTKNRAGDPGKDHFDITRLLGE